MTQQKRDEILVNNIKAIFREAALQFSEKNNDKLGKARTIHELSVFIAQSDFADNLAFAITNNDIKTERPLETDEE